MNVAGQPTRTLWIAPDGRSIEIIDQTRLPHDFVVVRLDTLEAMAHAITSMQLRGAPLIGVAGAHGIALAMRADASDAALDAAASMLLATRPTAVNLRWALDRMTALLRPLAPAARVEAAYQAAARMADADVATCAAMSAHGEPLLRALWQRHPERPLQLLTHCNAGWLATVDWGTALGPIYRAHDAGIPLHVWVDETRPRNQGYLTAWELGQHGIPHTVIADNAGGLLMRQGKVDACLVGTDRTTRSGDVANKIGTYLKALAAHDCGIPFYVAAPSSSIDWSIRDGMTIPIEERDPSELHTLPGVAAHNPGFDVTPARLVTAVITERGVSDASEAGLLGLFPEQA